MYVTDCFNSVEAIELVGASIEGGSKVIVAGEVLVLDLKLGWSV